MITVLMVGGLALAVVLSQKFTREWWFKRQNFNEWKIHRLSPNIFTSPVDGTVVYIKNVEGGKVTTTKQGRVIDEDWVGNQDGILIGIYMCIYDRHFIQNPVGDFMTTRHRKTEANIPMMDLWEYINFYFVGRFVDWFEEKAFDYKLQNEKVIYDYDCGIKLMGIADKFVNKIELPTDIVFGKAYKERGEKIGYIKRGSQVDVFIPSHLYKRTSIEVGDKVKAGEMLCRLDLDHSQY